MDYLASSESILKKALEYGYQMHPQVFKILESLDEKKALEVLGSISERFPEEIVIEVKHVEELLKKKEPKKPSKMRASGSRLRGKITEIYEGSGLIQRCPTCDRWIIDNFCIVHSDVDGVWDLRIKAKFEDGKRRRVLIFKKDVTEKSTNITLEEAKNLGEATTLERIKKALIGKNFEIEGAELNGGNFLVKNIREI